MSPEQYNYEFERTRRANMQPWEVMEMLCPALREIACGHVSDPIDCGCGMGEDCPDPLNEQTPLNEPAETEPAQER